MPKLNEYKSVQQTQAELRKDMAVRSSVKTESKSENLVESVTKV